MMDFVTQAVGYGGLIYGLYTMGDNKLRGPLIAMFSEAALVGVGVNHQVWSLTLIGLTLFIVQGRNFLKWKAAGVKW